MLRTGVDPGVRQLCTGLALQAPLVKVRGDAAAVLALHHFRQRTLELRGMGSAVPLMSAEISPARSRFGRVDAVWPRPVAPSLRPMRVVLRICPMAWPSAGAPALIVNSPLSSSCTVTSVGGVVPQTRLLVHLVVDVCG